MSFVNRGRTSLNVKSLEITLTVPLRTLFKRKYTLGRSSISSGSSRSTHSSGSTIVYNLNSTASTASNSTAFYAVNPDSATSSVTYSTTGNPGRQLINDKLQGLL